MEFFRLKGAKKRGGAGVQDTNLNLYSKTLRSDNAIIVNQAHIRLYAVNQGSDTIAVLNILSDGSLSPIPGSPFNSGGSAPASLSLAKNESALVVVNSTLDGKPLIPPGRSLSHTRQVYPNITSFEVQADGSPGRIIQTSLSDSYHPQSTVIATSDGSIVFGSDRCGDGLSSFRLDSANSIGVIAFFRDYVSSDRITNHSAGLESPLDICVNPIISYIYVTMTGSRNIAVYQYMPSGLLNFVGKSEVIEHFPSLLTVNHDGTRLYSSNAVTGDVSVFDIATDPLTPKLIQIVNVTGIKDSIDTHGNPWNLSLNPTGNFLYTLCPRHFVSTQLGDGNTVHFFAVDSDGKLLEVPNSTISLNLPPKTNPQGLVVL